MLAENATTVDVRQVQIVEADAEVNDAVRVADYRSGDHGKSGIVEKIDDSGVYVLIKIKGKTVTRGPFEKGQLQIMNLNRTAGFEQLTKEQHDYECYALFVVVEKLRNAIGIDRDDMRLLDVIVRNKGLYEWFTDRIGQTEVVRHGRAEPLFFNMPPEYLDPKRSVYTEDALMDVLMEAPRNNSEEKLGDRRYFAALI
eukprot:SAG31_NODE_845_length_11547_cov_8.098096_4_plen_198_part_00